jgi:phosphopantothenoylcysteine synthetase/decarboxylase
VKNPDIVATIAQQQQRPFMVGLQLKPKMLSNMQQENWLLKNSI